jgi:hypothetical protein
LSHQGVKEWELAEERTSGKEEGIYLHGIVEAFFGGSWEGQSILSAWPAIEDGEHFAEVALARLEEATTKLLPTENQTVAHLRFYAWPKFVAHLRSLYADRHWDCLTHGRREHAFKGPVADAIPVKNIAGELHGTIDSVDSVDGYTVITDYKRKGVPDGKELRSGLCSQLLLYAKMVAKENGDESFDRFLLGYYSLLDGEWIPVAVGSEAKQRFALSGLVRKNTPLVDDLMKTFHENLEWRLKDVEAYGRYYADPSLCGMCSYDSLCRKDDPAWTERVAEQNALEKRMQNDDA